MKQLPLLLILCFLPSLLFARYDDPKLKVLLFDTSSPFTISSSAGFKVRQIAELRGSKKVTVRPQKGGAMGVGKVRWKGGGVLIASAHSLWVRRAGHRARRYSGSLEVVPHKKGVYLINHIHTEAYLAGVLGAEIKTSWPMAAVKAQAVIARTYALYRRFERKHSLWHLSASTGDQVYLGLEVADQRAKFAIEGTRGVVVSYKGRLAKTFFHANCGGMTEDPGMVWSYSFPYYQVFEVPFGMQDPGYEWEVSLTWAQLSKVAKKIGLKKQRIQSIEITQRTSSGRAHQLQFSGRQVQNVRAKDFRKFVGYNKVKSLMFEVTPNEKGILIIGQGRGHGVGLCQWAAKEMGDKGYSYQDILHFFYRPTDLGYYEG